MDPEQTPLLAESPQRKKFSSRLIVAVSVSFLVLGVGLLFFLKPVVKPEEGFPWTDCGALKCGTLMVPLNHLDPNSEQIGVALIKYPAKVQPAQRSVLVNPGGPGGSGKQFVKFVGAELSSAFDDKVDIIGFDPRGVGETLPLKCYNDEQYPTFGDATLVNGAMFLPKNSSHEEVMVSEARKKLAADLCALNSKDSLGYLSTANVARDMDAIRVALKMDKMDYWGTSYGTYLGATYANMFPENVGRMIIDGVVDPVKFSGDSIEFLKSYLFSIEKVLRSFGEECDKSSNCPLQSPEKKSIQRVFDLLERLRSDPMIVADSSVPGVFTSEMLQDFLIGVTYSPQIWPMVASMLLEAENGNASQIYDAVANTRVHQCPTLDVNQLLAFPSIFCADTGDSSHQYSLKEWQSKIKEAEPDSPTTIARWDWILSVCRHWKRFPNQERFAGPWNASFANPLLIVGNTFDPVTPLSSAIALNKYMNRSDQVNSVLLTHDGHGHCSSAQPSICTANYMKEYILEGKLPKEGTVCVADAELFPAAFGIKSTNPKLEAMRRISEALVKINKSF